MNKAEQYKAIVNNKKTTLENWINYFSLLRRYKKAAKEGYIGLDDHTTTELNPWLVNKLKSDGFKIKTIKDQEKGSYVSISWNK